MPKKKTLNFNFDDARVGGAFMSATNLFCSIIGSLGESTAREIFNYVARADKAEEAEFKNWLILHRYDCMSKPNVMALARQLSGEGMGTQATVDHRIRELLRKRKREQAAGTWPQQAPPWPWARDLPKTEL